jgi:hypothetical protein
MDKLGFDALAILFVLLPGFLTAWTVHFLCFRPEQTELDKVVEALVFSCVIYATFFGIRHTSPFNLSGVSDEFSTKNYTDVLGSADLVWLLAIALGLGLLISASITNDWHMWLLRKLHVTERTARPTIWNDVFHKFSTYVQINFQDGRTLIGKPTFFSDTPDESSVFLTKAAWVKPDGVTVDIPDPGILVMKSMPIESIMFMK